MSTTSRRELLAAGAALLPAAALAASHAKRADAPPCQGLLAGKVAVIYGAAGNIGSGVSRAFAREGAVVHVTGRTLDKVEALAREITASGGTALPARVDALDPQAIEQHLATVVATNGHVDVSFNLVSVGGAQGTELTLMKQVTFAEPIETAMRTQFFTATAAGRQMAHQRSGVILALTAQVARKPYPASGGFGVACAAMEGLCRQLAVELGPAGVRVVTLRSSGSPDAPPEEFEAKVAAGSALKRMPLIAEVASAAVLMASDRASAITAAVTNVTCGEIAD